MSFGYSVYGIAVRSEIELPYLIASDAAPQVEIVTGSLEPGAMPGATRYRNWEALPGYLQIEIEGVARLRVTEGRTITVDAVPGIDPRVLVMHILGSAFGAVMLQRGVLPMHASAVESDRGAVLITGTSGAGKSTTVRALSQRGFRMMSDDVIGITFDDAGKPIAHSGIPASRLWQDSVERLGVEGEGLAQVRDDLDKYHTPVANFRAAPLPIHAVVLLDKHERAETRIAALPAAERIGWLLQHSFRKRFVDALGLRTFHFDAVTKLAQGATIVAVTRPTQPFDPLGLADRITDFLGIAPAA